MTDTINNNVGEQVPPPSSTITSPPPPSSLLYKSEEDLYAMAFAEVKSDARRQGLWAKAISEALGDDPKASAIYIRLRVAQLISEQTVERRASPVIFNCPHCGIKLKLTKGELDDTASSRQFNWNRSCSACKKVFDCRTVILGFDFSLPPSRPDTKPNVSAPSLAYKLGQVYQKKVKTGYVISGTTIIIIVIWALMFYFQESNKFKMQKKISDAYRNHPNQWQR